MKNRLLSGIAVAVFGLLLALVPVCIFPACAKVIETAAGGTVPMKCFWSGQAEIGVGLLILCGGVLLIVFKSPLTRIGVSVMTALAGVLGLLVPTLLIGGCEMSTMACRMTTFPAAVVLSILTVAACAANAHYLWRQNKNLPVKTDGR
ncbi:protein of unknown function [Sporobacter termitidis DSM 10068]|uniref:DUF4418 domain-containing protein n=1 Tax=Sporobacter termitidis DSM 10068 TaxID=1123282 RepID=A0A1M5XTL0_9FIRM|nr:DUF4418 family protein [Sporobacter termitidis]SHI03137.1 protein of unknown function [Sporobacter termitidis DSM 10068]